MDVKETVEGIRGLSDGELLARLNGVVVASRRLVAVVLAHLAEVEERRLHLLSGYASLFAYCTLRLGLSEDEAYRRVRVARLARRFPVILERLASGQLSLSVASLLEQYVNEANHVGLLDAVAHATVARAREVLAVLFPRPDVLPCIRKLPERSAHAAPLPAEGGAPTNAPLLLPRVEPPTVAAAPSVTAAPAPAARAAAERPAGAPASASPSRAGRAIAVVEPLSAERYKIVFTADADLKRKLELARDLLRHALPSGDLAAIVGRSLDLLIEKTLRTRFANTSPPKPRGPSRPQRSSRGVAADGAVAPREATERPPVACRERSSVSSASARGASVTEGNEGAAASAQRSRRVPNASRRAVFARDGLRCTWRGPDGTRCDSRAWLEHDHITPRGRGGGDEPANGRIFCRAHNRLAAEQAYGQNTIKKIISRRQAARHRSDTATDDGTEETLVR